VEEKGFWMWTLIQPGPFAEMGTAEAEKNVNHPGPSIFWNPIFKN